MYGQADGEAERHGRNGQDNSSGRAFVSNEKRNEKNEKSGERRPVQNVTNDVDPTLRNQESAVAATLMRDAYAREKHAFLMRIILILACVTGFSAAMSVALAFRNPGEHFFVENQAGQIIPIVGLDQPVASLSFVETWTTNALMQANTYDFANYRQQLGQAQQYFTTEGWNSWVQALESSGNLEAVKSNKMVASAVPTGAPVVDISQIVGGVMTWRFEIPVELDYQVLSQKTPQHVLFIVTTVRVPISQSPSGLGIQSISFK